jgi:calcineurin-like phosphoesterase family protein
MTIYFTADPHFGHQNIIRYCDRPFASAQEMDRVILERVNSVVQPTDTLYVLGDFCLGVSDRLQAAEHYRRRIACKQVHLIWGNHDPLEDANFAALFTSASHLVNLRLAGQRLTLCHYAMRSWDKSHHGAWQLYGHSHGTLPEATELWNMDVGVDCWNFYPISFEQVSQVMEHKKKGGVARDWTIEAGRLLLREKENLVPVDPQHEV